MKHYQGLPPDPTQGKDHRNKFPLPHVIVLEGEEGNVTLNRFTANGVPVGDTWHQTVDDAKHQAEYEYGDALGTWLEVPIEVSDATDYALASK
ncbi:MAG: hypothetical protein IPO81_27970 [Kouleothrix sp.]|nr:hypothetical protein [Kouleothrix sp.]